MKDTKLFLSQCPGNHVILAAIDQLVDEMDDAKDSLQDYISGYISLEQLQRDTRDLGLLAAHVSQLKHIKIEGVIKR
ncbi:MAG: hypothetical protein DRJ03_03310 [Chloroflexi bacterium]|nr:MAG: hypothetical protein DRJ03_03310 [Chloroflexota bacterium]